MRRLCLVMLAAALVAVAASGCALEQRWQPPQVVMIHGGEVWIVMSPLYLTSFHAENGGAAVLVRDGELLTSNNGIFPYFHSDGSPLVIVTEDSRVILNGRTVSLKADEKGLAWLEKAKPESIAALRFVDLSDAQTSVPRPVLERLAKANPRMGLHLKADDVGPALALFKPRWLMIDESNKLDEKAREALAATGPLDMLLLGDVKDADLSFLGVNGWPYGPPPPLPPQIGAIFITGKTATRGMPRLGFDGLRSLIDVSSEAATPWPLSLRQGENMPGVPIEELSLIGCKNLDDIRGLLGLYRLKTLVMTGSGDKDKPFDLTPLKYYVKELRWLGLPPSTTQAQLEEVVKYHPDLLVLELAGCEKITDLAPLEKLTKLPRTSPHCIA